MFIFDNINKNLTGKKMHSDLYYRLLHTVWFIRSRGLSWGGCYAVRALKAHAYRVSAVKLEEKWEDGS
jgi:hypothetical protein